jgi:histidyl-tRNA synthetase
MASKFQAPRGTFDVLPGPGRARARLQAVATGIFERAGYEMIQTPTFEDTDLFERGVGKSTDIVRKEMFTFEDKGERSLTLRPEGTAPICRAYLEHGMHKMAQPVKLSYIGPFFRHERPQAGRYRQFHQLGIEAIGTASPLADAEVIMLLSDLLGELGVPGVVLRLGSLGSLDARAAYLEELKAHLHRHEGDLTADVRERIDINPLRAFDSDAEGVKGVMASAPTILDALSAEDAEHFAEVRELLDAAGVGYTLDGSLVRGLDYYNRTVFEFACDRLGAQSGIGGGGRYDGLVELLGGPATPAVGWAAGIERILLAMETPPEPDGIDVFVVAAENRARAFGLVAELRDAGLAADLDLAERSFKGQMKQADRSGARHAVILEPDGTAKLRDMTSGEQRDVDPAALAAQLITKLSAR